jgi:hypothetical protein
MVSGIGFGPLALFGGTMRQIFAALLATALLFGGSATAQTIGPGGNAPVLQTSASVPVTIASATTTLLLAGTAQTTYLTAFFVTMTGTTPTLQLEYGAGSTCATGTVTLTGAMGGASLGLGNGLGQILGAIPPNQNVCAVSGGTSPSIQGFLSYDRF